MHLRVIKQSPGTDEARGCGHDKCEAASDESNAAVAPERSEKKLLMAAMVASRKEWRFGVEQQDAVPWRKSAEEDL